MSPAQPFALREFTETLRYELDLQGIPSFVSTEGFPAPRSNLVYVLVDPRAFIELEGIGALPDDAVLRRTVLLGAERPEAIVEGDHLELLKLGGAVFDLNGRTVAAMRRRGIAARALKSGYSRLRDHYDPDCERPLDVMFLGTHSLRRTELLCRWAHVFARHNCLLHLAPARGGVYLGDSRWSLLAQTKIVINLHHHDDDSEFEWLRALDAIHAGAVVVSEHSSGIGALEPGRHLLVASDGSLPYLVDSLLADEPRQRRIRAAAYERVSTWLPFALYASIFRAALIEVLGQPLHPGVALSGRRALRRSDDEPDGDERDGPMLAARLADNHAELVEVREELIQVRRQAASLRRALLSSSSSGRFLTTPAWEARRGPRVSVVVTTLDDASELPATLTSFHHSDMSDLELVIVDGGSTDGSMTVAEHWLRERPRLPGIAVTAHRAEGRGAARNVALRFVRGEFVLILDPGASVYPHCVERLASTLASMGDTPLVYPMIEVTGDSSWFARSGGDHLLNAFQWVEERLRTGSIVHAPYLIRARALTALGGYATTPELDGFEDYDLMCRVAERGWRGQLVAQILGRRSELPGRTCLPTIHPTEGPATRALVRGAPHALAGAFAS